MAKLKEKLLEKSKFPMTYHFTPWEYSFLKDMNTALATSIYHKRLMSGILTYIVRTRLGVEPRKDEALRFELDLNKDDMELIIDLESLKED
jgi:hypothetical protein